MDVFLHALAIMHLISLLVIFSSCTFLKKLFYEFIYL
jgi:hypothetical protein